MSLSIDSSPADAVPGDAPVNRPTLPLRVTSLEEVPAELEVQYEPDGSGGYIFKHAKPLKTALAAERTNVRNYKEQVRKWQQVALHAYGNQLSEADLDSALSQPEMLDGYIKATHGSKFVEEGVTPEAIDQRIKLALSDKERDFNKEKRTLTAQVELLTKEKEDYRNKWIQNTVDQQYRQVLGALPGGVAVVPGAERHLLNALSQDTYWEVGENGKITIYVNPPEGSDVPYDVNGMGNPKTISELLEKDYLNKYPYFFMVPAAEPGLGSAPTSGISVMGSHKMGGNAVIGSLRPSDNVLRTTRDAVRANPQQALEHRKNGVRLDFRD